jgi:PAS domain S-box-containing protein
VRPDGERREVRVRGAAMQEGDTTVRVTGVLQDITERKQREEQLRMLSTAVEHAQDSVVITEADAEGTTGLPIVYVNEAFEAMTGYDEDELLGKTPRMLQGPETDRDVLDRVRAAIEAEEPVTAETVNYQKDGTPFIVQWNIAPVRDPDGTVQHWVSVQRDVTRRRRMEAELREREEYLSVTLNSIGDAFIATDTDGRITAINARAEKLTGWARDEAEGRPLADVFRIRDAQTGEPAETPVDEVLRTEEVVELTKGTLLTARDGTERQIADSAAPIQTEEGDLLGVVLVFRDVTEKMERQRALEMERQRFKMALTGGNLGLWDWDMTTDAVVYNERWAQMLGYTLDEVEFTKDFFEAHVHPEDRDRVFEAVRRHARGETPFIDLEIRMRSKDGSWRWMLDRGQILERDEEGQPQRMVGTHLDITERKQAEEQLRHERNVLQRIFDASPAAIVMLDAEGTFTYASARAEEVLGVPPEEVTGRTYDDADWGLEAPGGQSLSDDELPFTQVMRSGESIHGFEHTIKDDSGARRVLSVHGAPLKNEQGTPEGAVFVLEDVTDQKQVEAQLRQAQKLETMGTLAGGIAHDFNNILHAAMAYLQFIREEVPDDHAVRTYLDRVESGMGQARGLVRKLLTFSRPEQAAAAERLDVGPLVQGVLELAEPALPKRVEVRTALREDCTVWGDAGQLRQVVMNLLTNAAQAIEEAPSGDGDVLDVRVHPVDVDTELASRYMHLDAGRYVQISVSDTGPGMDADTKARVFDPFFTTKEAGEQRGTGLGLSVVHGIVQAMDGEITVHTERGEGTTFNVYLPDASGPAGDLDAEAQSAARTAPTDARGHILVVDDDPDVTELESIRLSRLGYRVIPCQHGDEALEVLRHNEQVDLVLTDYRMPGVNGLDLARTLRQHDAAPDIPVVLMSGFRAHVSEDEAQAAGICAVLQKPVGRGTLRGILREHIR